MTGMAMVTGAARGIGLAIAKRLAQDGWRVAAVDQDGGLLDVAAAHLRESGLQVEAYALDVCDRRSVAALLDRLSGVSLIVNNAGIASKLLSFEQLCTADFARMVEVNVRGTFVVSQEGVRRMARGGRIINIASRGYLGGAGSAHYVASKAAVVGLTRAMAVELRWSGITVNAVAPGMVDTRMVEDFTDDMRRALVKREPDGKPAQPEAIAGVVAFLASKDAANINGQVLFADGGKSVGVPPL